jgi:malate dehydrogenase (oxaloacetate-decarboxylating)(NADP+)
MLRAMGERPLIFALANPEPEVSYDVVERARPDAIFASGRSDYPNQVNNVLAFPSIFRGALDVRATCIDEEMKLAACRAIAALARASTSFGRDYIIPLPLDSEVLPRVAAAVAGAAMRTGAASRPVTDLAAYSDAVATRVRRSHEEPAHRAPAAPEACHG